MTSLLDVPSPPAARHSKQAWKWQRYRGQIPFAITRARLGQVLRGWASVNAVTDLAAGSTTVSISPEGRTPTQAALFRDVGNVGHGFTLH
jgi:hypothetical protein